jgi:hypothetical protein
MPARLQHQPGNMAGLTECPEMAAQAVTEIDAAWAARRCIGPRPVNAHFRSMDARLGVASRSDATRYAIKHALISSVPRQAAA